jgi:hypothetical protein
MAAMNCVPSDAQEFLRFKRAMGIIYRRQHLGQCIRRHTAAPGIDAERSLAAR